LELAKKLKDAFDNQKDEIIYITVVSAMGTTAIKGFKVK